MSALSHTSGVPRQGAMWQEAVSPLTQQVPVYFLPRVLDWLHSLHSSYCSKEAPVPLVTLADELLIGRRLGFYDLFIIKHIRGRLSKSGSVLAPPRKDG